MRHRQTEAGRQTCRQETETDGGRERAREGAREEGGEDGHGEVFNLG